MTKSASNRALDEANQEFWNELCGTKLATELGITGHSSSELLRYDEWYFGAMYPYLSKMLDWVLEGGPKVLEIGLGYGTVAQYLASRTSQYQGMDIASAPVAMVNDRIAQEGLEGVAQQASALDMPFEDASMDAIVSIGCLHHTGNLRQALGEVQRVLRPGGRALIMVYNRNAWRNRSVTVRRQIFRFLREGAWTSYEEVRRHNYDHDSTGVAAPATEFVSRKQLRTLMSGYASLDVQVQNYDMYRFVPRGLLLASLGRVVGTDIYVLATK